MLSPGKTLAVISGAKEWPALAFDVGEAFGNSAEGIRDYLTGQRGLGIPPENLLWLFNENDAAAQCRQIFSFLTKRLADLGAPRGADIVILFFYVGHGGFFGPGREYYLLVRDTEPPMEDVTSLRPATLARLLQTAAPESSRVLILDCCFAAEAVRYFQGGLSQAVSAETDRIVDEIGPDRGVALLCAASARSTARLQSLSTYTLFGLHDLLAAYQDPRFRVGPGIKPKEVRAYRVDHHVPAGEEVLAAWTWKKLWQARPRSLIFTDWGVERARSCRAGR